MCVHREFCDTAVYCAFSAYSHVDRKKIAAVPGFHRNRPTPDDAETNPDLTRASVFVLSIQVYV